MPDPAHGVKTILKLLEAQQTATMTAVRRAEKAEAELAAEREKAFTAMRVFDRYRELEAQIAAAEAERDALRALLREACVYVADVPIAEAGDGLLASIDAALKGDK